MSTYILLQSKLCNNLFTKFTFQPPVPALRQMANICIDVGRYEIEERKGKLASHCGSQHRLHMESFLPLMAAVGATITVSAAAATVTTVNLGPVSRLRRDLPWGPAAF